ncbi:AAA family ATPase [Micromonospora sp. NPDC049257]|uniref:AAA family ATPase n=1 Tax=Micromonospora sp. NPDC049257 TaxID=3155771 RepID=UPI00343399C9
MKPTQVSVLPYDLIVGQDELRRALEIAYVVPEIEGVLATGERGTAKSTTVRAFSMMMLGRLPVTLPIGATDDRVLGGWDIDKLLKGTNALRSGLLEQAHSEEGGGLLYIDEVNLLDDYLVNIILDAAAGGVLPVEREGIDEQALSARFTLVGTMNPEEGHLRPQLLDRFGLVATVTNEGSAEARRDILRNVLDFEADRGGRPMPRIEAARQADRETRDRLVQARKAAEKLETPDHIVSLCAAITAEFQAAGHRGDLTIANAARALAAIGGEPEIRPAHVAAVVPPALVHRRASADAGAIVGWNTGDAERLAALIAAAE